MGLEDRLTTDPTCEFCTLVPKMHVYHQDDICIVLDCDQCGEPMVIWKSHGILPPYSEQEHMFRTIYQATGNADSDEFQFDATRTRSNRHHWHAHLRPIGRLSHV